MEPDQIIKTEGFRLRPARRRYFSLLTSASFVMILILCLFTFCPYYNQEEKTSAEGAPNAVSSELTLDVIDNTAELRFSLTGGSAGSFATSGESINFIASTNNNSGYTIKYSASNDDGELVHEEGEFKFESIAAPLTAADFSAGDNVGYNNQWGFKPSKYVSDGNVINNAGDTGVFLPIPTTAGTVIDKTTVANSNDNDPSSANDYSIEIGARANLDIEPGEYIGEFALTIVANPVSYRINYNAGNTVDEVLNLPEMQVSATSETSITLQPEIPLRAHHSFKGWCDVLPTTTNGVDACTGTNAQTGKPAAQFDAGGEYGINQTTTNNATLYAMWEVDKFTQVTKVRYENSDGSWGDYSVAETKIVNYGDNYSWISIETATYQEASVPNYMVEADHENQVSVYRRRLSCAKMYRLENVDGTWSPYVIDTTDSIPYGGTCTYSLSIANYKKSATAANDTGLSAYVDNMTDDASLSLSFYRNTYSCSIQSRDQATNGTYGSYTPRVNSTLRHGQTCAWSANADSTYKAVNYSAVISSDISALLNRDRKSYTCFIQSRFQNANGTYASYVTRVNTTMLAGNTCAWSYTADSTYKTAGYSAAISSDVSQSLNIDRQSYSCYIQSRDQGTNGAYGGYTARVNTTMLAGNTCAWSSAEDATFKAAGYSATISSDISQSLNRDRKTYTCRIQSRHQYGDGNYTGSTDRVYTTMYAGNTCAWSSAADATYKAVSYSATITSDISKLLSIDRQTYTLTVDRNASYIGSVSGGGTYRVGQTASISAAASSGNEFTSWSQTAGTAGTFGNAAAASTTFVMPASNATVYANGKSSAVYIQNITASTCPTTRTTVTDSRDGKTYTIQKITAGGNTLCWMTSDLNLAGGTTITPADSNVSYDYTLPASSTSGFNSATAAFVYNSSTTGYYNYVAATAGTPANYFIDASYDICPKGWRLPMYEEYNQLISTYTTVAAITGAPWYGSTAGAYNNGRINFSGGWYQTATGDSQYMAYHLVYDSVSGAFYTESGSKGSGMAVRCVAK